MWCPGMGTHTHHDARAAPPGDQASFGDEEPFGDKPFAEDPGNEEEGDFMEASEDDEASLDTNGSSGGGDDYYEEDPFAQVLLTADGENIPDVLKGIQLSIEALTDVMEKHARVLYKILTQLTASSASSAS